MKRAHSAWPRAENVHEAWRVSCFRSRSWLTSNAVVPPSPTKPTRPQVAALRTAPRRPSEVPEQSIVVSAPSPWVSSRIAATGSVSFALTTASAPDSRQLQALRAMSTAMTRAPIAAPSSVAEPDRPLAETRACRGPRRRGA
jgi:hypothetical protein